MLSLFERETKEQVEVRLLQVVVLSEQERMVARRFYAPAFFALSCCWLLVVTGLMFCSGFTVRGFHLSDPVLIAAATTTTANIVGTLLVVARYLFAGANQALDTKAPALDAKAPG